MSRCHVTHDGIGTSEEVGLSDDKISDMLLFDSVGLHQFRQGEVGIAGLKLIQSDLVVVGLHIPQFRARLRYLGQFGFHAEHIVHFEQGYFIAEAEELEHIDNMLLVGLSDLGGSLIIVEIILFLSECQTALVDVEDVPLGIFLIGTEIGAVGTPDTEIGVFLLQLLKRVL